MNPREPVTRLERAYSRRSILKAGAAAGSALAIGPVLAACGGDDDDSSPAKGDSGSLRGTGEVVIGSYKDDAIDTWKAEVLPAFERDTGITPKLLEDEYGTFFEKTFNDAQSGAGQYDVYLLDDPWIPQFGAAEVLADLGELGVEAPSDLMEPFAQLGYWPPESGPRVPGFEDADPRLVAIPFLGDLEIFAYRKDIFESGVSTWDDVVEQGRKAQQANRGHYATVMRGVAGNPIVANWDPVFRSFGGEWFDDAWKVTFNSDQGAAAADFYVETLRSLCPPGVAEYDGDQIMGALLSERAYSSILYSGQVRLLLASKLADRFAFDIIPRQERSMTQIGIWIAGVPESAPNKENAAKFLRWSVQNSIQKSIARANLMPVTRPAFEDPRAEKIDPVLPIWLKQLDAGASGRPRTPDWVKVEDLVGTALNEALVAGSGGGEALNKAADEVTAYLERQGYYG